MHELSIIEALVEQLRRCAPPNAAISRVRLEIGARQSIDESALHFAWDAIVRTSEFKDAKLDITVLPWSLTCNACSHVWKTEDPLQCCPLCNSEQTRADGSSILHLQSIEISTEPVATQGYF